MASNDYCQSSLLCRHLLTIAFSTVTGYPYASTEVYVDSIEWYRLINLTINFIQLSSKSIGAHLFLIQHEKWTDEV